MRGMSTFGAFTTARLGIYASQKALDVTGHNITNINTKGYTRQRLDQMSFKTGGTDAYASSYDARVGSGVLCTGVSQLRDPYLDIRFRGERSKVGASDAKLAGLDQLTSILDEVAKSDGNGILEKQINDMYTQLENLSLHAGKNEFDTLFRSAAGSLCQLLNDYSKQLSTLHENQVLGIHQDKSRVNEILKGIGDLNDTIMKSEIHGDPALELRDQRNLLIDELSYYMDIDVSYKEKSVGAGQTVEELYINLAGTPNGDPDKSKTSIVEGSFYRQFEITDATVPNGLYDPDYVIDPANPDDPRGFQYITPEGTLTNDENAALKAKYMFNLTEFTNKNNMDYDGDAEVLLGENDLYGALQSNREILTEKGEFSSAGELLVDKEANSKRGIPYYQKSLDVLANSLARMFNESNNTYLTNQKGELVDKAGELIQYYFEATDTNQTSPILYDPQNPPMDTTVNPPVPLNIDLKTLNKDTLNATIDPTDANAVERAKQLKILADTEGVPLGGNLFSTSNDRNDDGRETTDTVADDITAANISISNAWSVGTVRVVNSTIMGSTPGEANSGANDNVIHMLAELLEGRDFTAGSVEPNATNGNNPFFVGNFQQMLGNISGTLANDVNNTQTLLTNYATSATELEVSRMSISSVDLNDEASNLMQYQKSYSAACRLMTTVDEMLDKIINGTGMVGR